MKILHLIILTACAGATTSAYADNGMLPPVLDSSTAYRASMMMPVAGTAYTSPAPLPTYTGPANYQITTRLNALQGAVTQIQAKINQQNQAINSLQVNVNQRLNSLAAGNLGTIAPIVSPVSLSPFDLGTSGLSPSVALGGEKARYTNAYATLRSGNFNQAILEFQGLVRDYPRGDYADNAQYWLGEAYIKKGDKSTAMKAFDTVVQAYPKSDKVPDALLKLGFVKLSLNDRLKAKEYLNYVIIKYPGTTAASLAVQKISQAAL